MTISTSVTITTRATPKATLDRALVMGRGVPLAHRCYRQRAARTQRSSRPHARCPTGGFMRARCATAQSGRPRPGGAAQVSETAGIAAWVQRAGAAAGNGRLLDSTESARAHAVDERRTKGQCGESTALVRLHVTMRRAPDVTRPVVGRIRGQRADAASRAYEELSRVAR